MTDKRTWEKSPEALVAHFLKTMQEFEDIEHRKMFGYPCCFANGYLFTGLAADRWILRLPKDEQDLFAEEHPVTIFAPFPGRFMKEYIVLPHALRGDLDSLIPWLERSLDYVKGMPPKPKKKPKKKS